MMLEVCVHGRKSHRSKRHWQNSSGGGLSKHKVASDFVIDGQDLSILSTQGSQLWPEQILWDKTSARGVFFYMNPCIANQHWSGQVFWSPWNQILSPGVKEVMQCHATVVVSTCLKPGGLKITLLLKTHLH